MGDICRIWQHNAGAVDRERDESTGYYGQRFRTQRKYDIPLPVWRIQQRGYQLRARRFLHDQCFASHCDNHGSDEHNCQQRDAEWNGEPERLCDDRVLPMGGLYGIWQRDTGAVDRERNKSTGYFGQHFGTQRKYDIPLQACGLQQRGDQLRIRCFLWGQHSSADGNDHSS